MFKNLRQSILVLIAVTSFLTFGFAVSAESAAQTSKKTAKAAPTPKKNAKATPTPGKKTQAKATPTPKKSSATTAKSKTADKKIADKKSSSAKNDTKDKSSKSKKETARNSKETKAELAKNSSSKSKTKKETKTVSKTEPQTKNSKATTRTRETKTVTTAKKVEQKKPAPSRKPETKVASKPKPKVEEATEETVDATQFVVTDVSAPVRASASAKAAETGKVKLGTILNVAQKNASWYKVQYSNGAKTSTGWIPASAVGSLDSSNKAQIYTQVANRYYKPQMDFATSSVLYEFLTRNQTDYDNSDSAADLQLKRLLALRTALKAIPVGEKDNQPYKDFLKNHGKEVVYSEPSGEYLTVSNLFWDLHKKYKASPNADEIAWAGAQNPLPGECEGYVNCHLFYARMTSGEYLNLHPTGKHNLEALTNLTNILEPIVADLNAKQIYNGPTDVTDRAEFNNLIAELRTIVSRLPLTEKERTMQQLKKIAEGFR